MKTKEKERNFPIYHSNPSGSWREFGHPEANRSLKKLRVNKSWKIRSWTGRGKGH